MSAYLIDGHVIARNGAGFITRLAAAHARNRRPVCLCSPQRAEMYIARLGQTFIVKRMPGTGRLHAPDCRSHQFTAESPGTTVTPTGQTELMLGFSMSKISPRGRSRAGASTGSESLRDHGMTVRELLRYLWDRAELTRWHPSFTGRRSWATVYKRLLDAAKNIVVCGRSLTEVLYIPEPFYVEHRHDIARRRIAHWATLWPDDRQSHALMLLIGELKEINVSATGHSAVIKHLPDRSLLLDAVAHKQLASGSQPPLRHSTASCSQRLIMIATFDVNEDDVPTIRQASLMPVDAQWIPIGGLRGQRRLQAARSTDPGARANAVPDRAKGISGSAKQHPLA